MHPDFSQAGVLHPRAAAARSKSIKFLTYFVISALVVFGATSLFVSQAAAQETTSSDTQNVENEQVEPLELDVADIDPTLLEDTPDEVVADSTVTEADLDVSPSVLPDSPLYGFKNLFRGVKEALTFNRVRKAELKINHASERVVEAEKLLDKKEAANVSAEELAKAQDQVEGLLEDYQSDLDGAIAHIENVKAGLDNTDNTGQQAKLDRVLDKLTDRVLKHDKIVDKIESKLAEGNLNPDRVAKIIEHKEQALEKLGHTLTRIEDNPDRVVERLDRVVSSAPGSEFKHANAMAVLSRVHDKLDNDRARDAIAAARDRMREHFETSVAQLPAAERFDRFESYMRHLPGNAVHHLEVVDELKAKADLPDEFVMRMEQLKEKMANKFEHQFRDITSDRIKDHLLRPLEEGDALDNLRLAEELKDRVPQEIRDRIAKHEQASVAKFRQAFAEDQNAQDIADRAEQLMEQARANPSPELFAALENLKNELTPEQRRFVDQIEEAGADEIEIRLREEGESFLHRVVSGDPADIEVFDKLREFGTSAADIEKAKKFQRQFVAEHIQNIDDPAAFARIKEQFDERPDLRREFTQHHIEGLDGSFDSLLIEREIKIDELKGRIEEEFRFRFEDARKRAEEFGFEFNPADFEGELREHKALIEGELRARFEHQVRPPHDAFDQGTPRDFRGPPNFEERHDENDRREPGDFRSPPSFEPPHDRPHDSHLDGPRTHDFNRADEFPGQEEERFPNHDDFPTPFERNQPGHDQPFRPDLPEDFSPEALEEAKRRRLEQNQRERDVQNEERHDGQFEPTHERQDFDRSRDNSGPGNHRDKPGPSPLPFDRPHDFQPNGFTNPERQHFDSPNSGPGSTDFRPPEDFNRPDGGFPPPGSFEHDNFNSSDGLLPEVRGDSTFRARTGLSRTLAGNQALRDERVEHGLTREHINRLSRLLTTSELIARADGPPAPPAEVRPAVVDYLNLVPPSAKLVSKPALVLGRSTFGPVGDTIGPRTSRTNLARNRESRQAQRANSDVSKDHVQSFNNATTGSELAARRQPRRDLVRDYHLRDVPEIYPSVKSPYFVPRLFTGFIKLISFNYDMK